jgi:hypothetical protein
MKYYHAGVWLSCLVTGFVGTRIPFFLEDSFVLHDELLQPVLALNSFLVSSKWSFRYDFQLCWVEKVRLRVVVLG